MGAGIFLVAVIVWALILGRVFSGSWLPTGGRNA